MKKTIALLLCLVMLFALAACGETGTTTEPAGVGEDTAAVTDMTETEEGWDGALPIVQPGEDNKLTIGIHTSAKVSDYDDNAFTHWVEEQTGVDLEFVQFSGTTKDAATQVSLMIAAGEELPDILWAFGGINKTMGEEYGVDGYMLDLSRYFDEGWNHYQKESFRTIFGDEADSVYHLLMDRGVEPTTGGLYCYPTIQDAPLDTPRYHTWINQEWLDNLGLEAPTTIDELYDVLVAFRDDDPNGNGKHDEIPMTGRFRTTYADVVNYVVNAFIYCDNTYYYNVTDGKLWAPYDQDEYRQATIFVNKLVSEGLLSPLTWTQTDAELKSLINTGDETSTVGVFAQHADIIYDFGDPSVFRYVPLQPLADATGRGGYCPRSSYYPAYTTRITSDCDNPDLAFKFLDFCNSQEACVRQRWGEYGVDWEYSDGTKPGNMGDTAKLHLINPAMWASVSSSCWHNIAGVSSEGYWSYEVDFSDMTDWDTNRATKLLKNYENAVAAGQPDEVFTLVAYTEDEYERRTEIDSDLKEYMKTAFTQFCNGILDPNDDAAWNDYLANLEAMGYYDPWITTAQSAYDRTKQY